MNKYEWIEGVMASQLSKATKVFAFGIFKHMNEGKAWPGDEALMDATGSGRGHFAEYRKALIEGGWLTAEPRKTKNGVSYTYYLPASLPPVGNQSATCGEQTATSGEQTATCGEQTATSGGMNTVLNPVSNPVGNTEEQTTDADAPVVGLPILDREGFVEVEDSATPLSVFEERSPADWHLIRRQRPLTAEENAFIEESSRRQNGVQTVAVGDEW